MLTLLGTSVVYCAGFRDELIDAMRHPFGERGRADQTRTLEEGRDTQGTSQGGTTHGRSGATGGTGSHLNQDSGTPPRAHLCNQPVMTS